jgi:beta-galactosidase/beta-glucuronidase
MRTVLRKSRRLPVFFSVVIASLACLAPLGAQNIPRPEYPRPEMERSEWLSLNGHWDFALDPGQSGEESGLVDGQGFDGKILVPFAPESPLSGVGHLDFMPAVWYKRTLRLPESWRGRRVLVHFEACDYRTTVWLNGKRVGEHLGGYTPFTFDLTDFLANVENLLVVRATDDVRTGLQPSGKQSTRFHSYGCMYRRTTGIWQAVWLEPVADSRVERYSVVTDPEKGEAMVSVYLRAARAGATVRLSVLDQGREVASAARPAADVVLFPIKIEKPRPWEVRKPYLYDFEVACVDARGEFDRVRGYFGFRRVEARGDKIYFNGRPLFLRTVLDQGFYPDGIYTAPSDEALKKDIETSLDFGFDGARLHQRVFERRYLYWADRLGYMVWGEFADWGLALARPEAYLILSREWAEAVERDLNHPAVIGWCPLNERWDESYPGLIRELFRLTKRLDPTRLAIDASGGYHLASPDVYDSHSYEQSVEKFKAAFDGLLKSPPDVFVNEDPKRHVAYAGQPYYVSEYGGIWWNPGQKDTRAWGYGDRPRTAEEFLERYRGLTEALLFNPRVAGLCYTQLYDVEQEVNGLCTFDRRPKFAPEAIRRINQQKAAIEKAL